MSTTRSRAAEAAEQILRFAKVPGSVSPINFVEAVELATNGVARTNAIAQAAKALAEYPDPVTAAREIAGAYFRRVPRKTADDCEHKPPKNPNAPAPAPAPGVDTSEHMRARLRMAKGNELRDLQELEAACEVIAEATLRTAALEGECFRISTQVRTLALKCAGRDKRASKVLSTKADALARSSKAAGTVAAAAAMSATDPIARTVDRAVAAGASADEVAAIKRFSKEFDQLSRTSRPPRMSRERFVEISMTNWKHRNR